MKFSMECNVTSNTIIETEISIPHNDRTYVFYPNDKGILSKLRIIAPVLDPTKFYSVITDQRAKATLHIEQKIDQELYDSVYKEFQQLESVLAFSYDLQGVDWAYPHYNLILESDEERDKAELYGYGEERPEISPPVQASEQQLIQTIKYKEHLDPLVSAMSFYREAINDLRALKHINEFFNCYFIIEGLFGNGKTKNQAVADEFKKSKPFVDFTQDVISSMKIRRTDDYKKLGEMLKAKNKAMTTDDVIELVVLTRGDLHHFQNNPNRPQGTPFRHNEYKAIAFLTRGLAINAIIFRVMEINQALVKEGKHPFIITP